MKRLGIKRYLRIYAKLTQLSLMGQAEYRIDFVIEAIGSILAVVTFALLIEIIFNSTKDLLGWSRYEILLIYGIAMFSRAVIDRFVLINLREIARMSNSGELDHFLTKPISPLFLISFHQFSLFAIIDAVLGLVISAYAVINLHLNVQLGLICQAVGILFLTGVIFYFILLAFFSLSFWLGNINHGFWVYNAMGGLDRLPVESFRGIFKVLFRQVMPFILFGAVPAAILLQRFDASLVIEFILSTLIWIIIGTLVWKLGLRSYSSAGG